MQRYALRLDELADALPLITLHIEEHEIRFPRAGAPGNLSHQHILHAIECDEQKSSQADCQRDRRRLVVRAMQVGQSLAPSKR